MKSSNIFNFDNGNSVNDMPEGFGGRTKAKRAAKQAAKIERKQARTNNINSKAESRVLLATQGLQQTTGAGQVAGGVGNLIKTFFNKEADNSIKEVPQILAPSILDTANSNNPEHKPLIIAPQPQQQAQTGNIFDTGYTTPGGQTARPIDESGSNEKPGNDLKKYLPYLLGAAVLYYIMQNK